MSISGAARVYGLIGDPVAHSLSPRLMNDAFARLGVDATYLAWQVARPYVRSAVAGLATLGVAGVNVTYPHKGEVLHHVEENSDTVGALGAANVLVRHGRGFRAENTDAGGTALALRDLLEWPVAGRRVVVVGAGGAGRAAALGLLDDGAARVDFLVRNAARAEVGLTSLRDARADHALAVVELNSGAAAACLAAAHLVVQATPVGLHDPGAAPLVDATAAPDAVGFELVYGEHPTAFAAAWRRTGRACLDGRDLLAAQAQLALRLWLDDAPDLATMRRVIATEEVS